MNKNDIRLLTCDNLFITYYTLAYFESVQHKKNLFNLTKLLHACTGRKICYERSLFFIIDRSEESTAERGDAKFARWAWQSWASHGWSWIL